MSKMKFREVSECPVIVAGVYLPTDGTGRPDYDELLCEAIRVALRLDINNDDEWDDLYGRIRSLINAYLKSPEGEGLGEDQDVSHLMARLASCVADVIPLAVRKGLL